MADRSSPKVPIMCGSATFTTLMSITAMNVPNITVTAMIHLLTAGASICGWLIARWLRAVPPGAGRVAADCSGRRRC